MTYNFSFFGERYDNKPKVRYTTFLCKKCGGRSIEEVSRGIIFNEIQGFYGEDPDYGDENFESTEVVRYQCFYCGERIIEGYSTDLYNDLKEMGFLDLEEKEEKPKWRV